MFLLIPVLVPILMALIVLVSPLWPVFEWQVGQGNPNKIPINRLKFLVFSGANILACAVIATLMWLGGISKSYFPEIWNYKVVSIKHEMEWTEKVRRSRQVACGHDKDGRTKYRTEYYYVTEHYGPYWHSKDEYGSWTNIGEADYNKWKKIWANEVKTGVHEGSSTWLDASIDGPIYECKWNGKFDSIYPVSKVTSYKNKIRVSNSVLRYGTPSEEALKNYPRPADKRNTSPVISYGGSGISQDIVLKLRQVNALLGSGYQIHTMLVMLGGSDPRGQVEDILKSWCGPNKNELVTFVSCKNGVVDFCEVSSWMDDTTLHATLRDGIVGDEWDANRYADMLLKYVPKLWKRKEFTPFNEYLKVTISPWWFWSGIIISIMVVVGIFFWIEHIY